MKTIVRTVLHLILVATIAGPIGLLIATIGSPIWLLTLAGPGNGRIIIFLGAAPTLTIMPVAWLIYAKGRLSIDQYVGLCGLAGIATVLAYWIQYGLLAQPKDEIIKTLIMFSPTIIGGLVSGVICAVIFDWLQRRLTKRSERRSY